jgi:lipopolysaccharide transport system permease protein
MSEYSSHLSVRKYSPAPILGHPVVLLSSMLADLHAGRELAWRLFVRDINAQYRQSYLGYVWALLPPLAGSLTFIFLNAQGLMKAGATGIPYAAFAMIGTLLWQVFADALSFPLASLAQSKSMLTKINFPREAILIAGLLMVIFNFLIRLVLLTGILCLYHVHPGGSLLMLPAAVIALIMTGSAVGLLIAPLGALYGDVGKSLPIITSFWMLLTPVVYPAKTTGLAGWLASWNPVSPLIITARESLTGSPITELTPFLCVFGISALVVLMGWIGFRITMPHLIARMGG